VKVIREKKWGGSSESVAVGLILQSMRLFDSKLSDVQEYAAGFPSRIANIQKSIFGQNDSLPRRTPPGFPKELCKFAHASCHKRLLAAQANKEDSDSEANKEEDSNDEQEETLRLQMDLFARCYKRASS
jgi:hypothetical protein